MAEQLQAALTIIRRRQVEAETSLCCSTIYKRIRDKTFPPAIPLGPKSVGWRRGDIDAWLANPAGYRAPEVK